MHTMSTCLGKNFYYSGQYNSQGKVDGRAFGYVLWEEPGPIFRLMNGDHLYSLDPCIRSFRVKHSVWFFSNQSTGDSQG